MQSRHSKLYCLCSRDIQNFIVCAVATFKTLLFVQSRHSKLYCLCSRNIQNFIVCAVATFKTLLFVQSRHSKLYCLCSRDIQNFIVCAVETFETLLFVQSRHSKLYCLCSRAIRNFLVCVSLLGLRTPPPLPGRLYLKELLNILQTVSSCSRYTTFFRIGNPFHRQNALRSDLRTNLSRNADVSENKLPFVSQSINNFSDCDISQPMTGSVPLCPLMFSWKKRG